MSESQPRAEFTVAREENYWVATHTDTGIASHGDDPTEAVDMATEALEFVNDDPEPASEAEQENIRRDLGIEHSGGEGEIETPPGMP